MPSIQKNTALSIDSIFEKSSTWGLVILVQSLMSIIWLLLIPKEPGNAVFLGYSLRRLALLLPMSLPLIGGAIIRFNAKRKAVWLTHLLSSQKLPGTASLLVMVGAVLAVGVWSFLFLFFFLEFFPDLGAFYRLIPWLASLFLLGLESILFVPIFIYPNKSNINPGKRKFPIKVFLIAFFVLLTIFILIEITGLGKNPERFSIITLGAPLLEGQIWYITGLLAMFIVTAYAWQSIPHNDHPALVKRSDLIIATILWLAAVTLWMSLPLPSHNYFAPEVQPPNFEKYPFSDAEQYDLESMNVYYGAIDGSVVSKPMYVSLLTILHAIGGLSYANIILLQTLIVGLFPPVLYLIGRELHSRLGGIAIAFFAIFREVSSIQFTSIGNVANTKLLLSDMPAALLAAILALIIIRWFKLEEKRISGHEFLIGGLIGIFALVRIQTILLIPAAILLVFFRYFPKIKVVLISATILLLASSLVLTPVLLRNHSITGVYWLDNPSSSAPLSRILTEGLESFEDEELLTTGDEVVNQNIRIYKDLLFNNFGFFVKFILDHFARNLLSSFLIMPVRLGNNIQFLDFLKFSSYFWGEVYSTSNLKNIAVILLNLLLICIGFSKAYSSNPKGSLLLVGFFLYYNLTSSIARLSGWRFILPVDWIVYVFFAIGIVETLLVGFRKIASFDFLITNPWISEYPEISTKDKKGISWYTSFALIFLFSGGFIPIREHLIPRLLPEYSREEVCGRIDEALKDHDLIEISEDFLPFCLSENVRALKGYGISPRFFKSGEGYYDRDYDPWFGRQDYDRLVFRLIGTQKAKVYIKTIMDDVHFPNGEIVYAVGRDKNKFEAQFVLVDSAEPTLIISSSILEGKEVLIPIE
jgi:hypothetical protein